MSLLRLAFRRCHSDTISFRDWCGTGMWPSFLLDLPRSSRWARQASLSYTPDDNGETAGLVVLPGVTPSFSPHPFVKRDANTKAGRDVALVVVVKGYDATEGDLVTEALDVAKDTVFIMATVNEKEMNGGGDLKLDEGVITVTLDEYC